MTKKKANAFEGDENEERGNWSSKADYLLSMLGFAVGLGNVWRFPYLTYASGGGAFLIPYFIMLFLAGLPLYFMEECIGQYCSLSPIRAWNSVPIMRGVGVTSTVVLFFISSTYVVVMTYCIFYTFASFTTYLPWSDCSNSWNTLYCATVGSECINQSNQTMIIINNGSCVSTDELSSSELEVYNITENVYGEYNLTYYNDPLAHNRVSASEEFWNRRVRREASSITETGGLVWELVGCMLLTYVIIFLCLIKGIKSSGKVVYFTATFPYVVIAILLVLGLTLPGHQDGISFFINPKWELLADAKIWMSAAIQIFYSLGASLGGIITLSSYNKFHNNSFWDALIIVFGNSFTSIFAGFAIFSVVGYMAHELNQPVESVVAEGFGLAFIAYPRAFTLLPAPPVWSILFFLMLVTLGLDSAFAGFETMVTIIVDEFPRLRSHKLKMYATVCTASFLFGLLYVTEAGPYWANLMDQSSAGFQLLIVGIMECTAISWIYGLKRFRNDIRAMIGDKFVDNPFMWMFMICWSILTPAILSFILMFNWMNWSDITYNGPYPTWALVIGWLVSAVTLIWIPVVWVYEFWKATGTFVERWQAMVCPRPNWGPALQEHREEAWLVHRNHGTTMGGDLKPIDTSVVNSTEEFWKVRVSGKFVNDAYAAEEET